MPLPSAMSASVAKSVKPGDRERPLDQGRGRQSGGTGGQIRAQTVVPHRQVSQGQDRQAVSRKVRFTTSVLAAITSFVRIDSVYGAHYG